MTGFRERGFHGSQAAIFSATVAAARLLHLDAEQTTHAIALTATSSSGLAKAADTSVAREYHAGMATMAGIQAVRAAQRGYQAEERILEMKLGFFRSGRRRRRQCGGERWPPGTAAARGTSSPTWRSSWCPAATHTMPWPRPPPTLRAKAHRGGGGSKASPCRRPGLTALSGPLHPKDLVDMAHSPAYFTAAGVADREFSWAHATPAKIADPVIHRPDRRCGSARRRPRTAATARAPP